jgi:hypothetical protein
LSFTILEARLWKARRREGISVNES